MKKILLLLVVVAALASCKKDNPKPPELTAITLSKDTISVNVGDTKSISFTLTPSSIDKSQLVWHSSDNSILTVDNSGTITGLKEGDAVITVTNQSATITSVCLVSVTPQLKGIKMVKDTLDMHAGDIKAIGLTLTPANSSASTLVWKSSDPTIVSVSSAGVATAIAQGVAVVTVTSQDGTLTAFCLISVAPMIDDLTVGLIAYYPFDDKGIDASGNGNDGTLNNITSVPDRFGKVNGAFHFDGLTSFISVPDKPALRLNGTDFTLTGWVKLDVYNNSYVSTIMSKRFSGLNNGWLWAVNGPLNTPNGAVYYGPGGGNADAIGNIVLNTNNWYMVTCIYQVASAQLSIYVNGVLDHTVNNILSANASTAATLYIGKDTAVPGSNSYLFQGSMDDLRMYSRAINASEIQKLYTATQ